MRMWPFCSVGGAARFHANTLREASEKCYECATKLREFLVFPSKKIASLNRGHVRPECKIGHCTLFWPTLMGNCGRSPIPNLTLLWQLRNASCFLGISRFPFSPLEKCNVTWSLVSVCFGNVMPLTPICCLYSFLTCKLHMTSGYLKFDTGVAVLKWQCCWNCFNVKYLAFVLANNLG